MDRGFTFLVISPSGQSILGGGLGDGWLTGEILHSIGVWNFFCPPEDYGIALVSGRKGRSLHLLCVFYVGEISAIYINGRYSVVDKRLLILMIYP